MNPIPVLSIPCYNRPDLLARCIESIDYPVDRLVLVQNGPEDFMLRFQNDQFHYRSDGNTIVRMMKCVKRLVVVMPGGNMGVAASWNHVIKQFAAPWWMLANNDIQFAPGDLERMAHAAWLCAHEPNVKAEVPPVSLLYGNHGASWFIITREGVRTVGLFDENIYPAYLEDCDWSYRAKLAGARTINVEGLRAIHGEATAAADQTKGSCTIHSDERLAQANMRTHGRNFEYYRAKWGGINGEEKFKTPFGLNFSWRDWYFSPELRELQQAEWEWKG